MELFNKLRKKDIVTEKIKELEKLVKVVEMVAKNNLKKYRKDPNNTKEQIDDLIKSYTWEIGEAKNYLKYYENFSRSLNTLIQKGVGPDDKEYQHNFTEKQKWYYTFLENVKKVEFMRPNTKEDALERRKIYENYGRELMETLEPNSDLRFHGTPIYYAKDIIKSKSISGSADRYDGYIKSTDLKGEFSASTASSVDRTIQCFLSLGSDYTSCLPCGVLFVLREKQGDEKLREYSSMQNIDFTKNSEQLVAILSTGENINYLTNWCKESNLDPSVVQTFDNYLASLRQKSM